MEKEITPNAWLRAELTKRQSVNTRYSLRSFAKTIEVSPGRVSEWLADKREISLKSIKSITKALGYSPSEATSLVHHLFQSKIKTEILGDIQQQKRHLMLHDQFQLVKD